MRVTRKQVFKFECLLAKFGYLPIARNFTHVLTLGLIQSDLRKKLVLNTFLSEQWKDKLNKTMNSLAQGTLLYGLRPMARCGGMSGSIP